MDFLDPKKQRRLSAQLMIGYVLVGFTVLLATTILIYYAYGFGVNREGDLVQKGLVFISSQPAGSELYVNDERLENTNAKLNLNAGKYKVVIKREGYHNWQRNIEVQGSDVDHYVYPFLFPAELTTNPIFTFETNPVFTTQSPDRRWLLALMDVNAGRFTVLDLNKEQDQVSVSASFSVPASLMTPGTGSVRWEVAEWSSNNRHLLLKRFYTADNKETFEYILADRQRPEGSHNLTRELGLTQMMKLALRDKKPDIYYIYDTAEQELRTATLDNPEPVTAITGVLDYKTHGDDTIVYATKENASEGMTAVKLRRGTKDYMIRSVKESDAYLLDAAKYDGDWYVVLGSQAENRVYIYQNPEKAVAAGKKPTTIFALRVDRPIYVSFSANAQYILAQNGKTFHIYDAENNRGYRYTPAQKLDSPQTKAEWMDGNRLTYVSGGKQVVFDYDNINRHDLVTASATFPSAFDQRYRYLYTFTPRANNQPGLTLSATAVRTEADL